MTVPASKLPDRNRRRVFRARSGNDPASNSPAPASDEDAARLKVVRARPRTAPDHP